MKNVAEDIGVNMYYESQFENNTIHNPRMVQISSLGKIKIITKNLYPNLCDDEDLNTCYPFKMNKHFYDDNNNNQLKDEGFHHEDDPTNYKCYSLINRIKNEHI